MSIEHANRSWARKQIWLLLGFLISSGACTRRDLNTRDAVGTSGAEGSGAVAAAPELASATGGRPVPSSRLLAAGAKSTVFVSTRQDDEVYALVDDDGDHEVDRVYVVARGLDTRDWITYRDRASSNAEISRALGIDGFQARPERSPTPVVVVTDQLPARQHHGWRYVRFGAGGWLYIPVRVSYQA